MIRTDFGAQMLVLHRTIFMTLGKLVNLSVLQCSCR